MQEAQSDRILDLVQSAIKVESEIETHLEEVAARLDEEFAPVFESWEEGREKPNFRGTLWAFKDKLANSRVNLSRKEERHIYLVRQAIELREERQELTAGLYEDFSSMRRTVEELYRDKGKGKNKGKVNAFVVAGIQGPTSQKPAKLLRQIDLAIQHMLRPGFEFPVSRFGGTALEPLELVKTLKPRAERLRQVLADLQGVVSEMNTSRKEKNRALETHRTTFVRVARGAESLFRLAGEHELAERIRPSGRRPGRRAVEVGGAKEGESPAEDSPEGSAEAGSAEDGPGEKPAAEPQPASPAVTAASEPAPSSPPADG